MEHFPDKDSGFINNITLITGSLPPCNRESDAPHVARKWYTVESRVSREPVPTLYCCQYCVLMFAQACRAWCQDLNTEDVFVETCRPPTGYLCDLRLGGPFIRAYLTAAEECGTQGLSDLSSSSFSDFIWSKSCPKDRSEACSTWFIPGQESYFCDKCYSEVIKPHLKEGHSFFPRFARTTSEITRHKFYMCNLWPRKMGQCLEEAIEANDISIWRSQMQQRLKDYFELELQKISINNNVKSFQRQADLFANQALCSQMLAGSAATNEILTGSSVRSSNCVLTVANDVLGYLQLRRQFSPFQPVVTILPTVFPKHIEGERAEVTCYGRVGQVFFSRADMEGLLGIGLDQKHYIK